MIQTKECIAMILAGGRGKRLGVLTKQIAKPAIHIGGKYRIIDFALSNCVNSNIDTVGVLTQYQPLDLNTYIGGGQPWDLDRNYGGVCVLPPYLTSEVGDWYKGTANAIYQNFPYIQQFNPKYVLILSGDQVYQMDYKKMLDTHIRSKASATIAVIQVPWADASRFGIMNCHEDGQIYSFSEKPEEPESNLASMGIYVFNWPILKAYLTEDEQRPNSNHDFGQDIIPKMLSQGEKLQSYRFDGYWRDVGTIQSLWECNMEMLAGKAGMQRNSNWRLYSRNPSMPPQFVDASAEIKHSMITEGCNLYGKIENSILFSGNNVMNEAVIRDSVIMPNVRIGYAAHIERAIIGPGTVIGDHTTIGLESSANNPYASPYCTAGITVIGAGLYIDHNTIIPKGSMISHDLLGSDKAYKKGGV